MLNIPCVIFAGGKSSRMGEDKALLPFSSYSTLTEYQYMRLSKIFTSVFISCKSKEKFNFEAQFIEDKNQEIFAPTSAFISIFSELNGESFFAISVDTPFVDQQIIQKLFETDKSSFDATIAVCNEQIHPLCGIYHRPLLKQFLDMEKNNIHKLNYLLKNSKTNFVNFSEEIKFLNLNHPSEYHKALQYLEVK